MYVVTGGAGFIGSNIVKGLNRVGMKDILVVDNLKNSQKFLNLTDLQIADYMGKHEFLEGVKEGRINGHIEAIFHQGACSDTMEYDGRYMMENNYEYSKIILHWALKMKAPFVYASSAAVYGSSMLFREEAEFERPLNIYGYSKLLFDRYVQRMMLSFESTVVGLRYFNVYGPREQHKGRMASMVHQLYHQLTETGKARLFQGSGGYGNGEQRRDFLSVDDVVAINLHFGTGRVHQGIYNAGTGSSRSFNDIARTFIELLGQGEIEYVPMPETLKEKYQNFTESDISKLRTAGYEKKMTSLEEGLKGFLESVS